MNAILRFRAFTLIELLVSIAIIALLIGIMLPALGAVRTAGNATVCLSNTRQLITAWTGYTLDYNDRAMPLAYFELQDVGTGDNIFWFGSDGRTTGTIDHAAGFLAPYLSSGLGDSSVYECPEQPWGTYTPQTGLDAFTTTYGYNGYFLSPPKTPGWGGSWGPIGGKPWQRVSDLVRPDALAVFADTLLPVGPAGFGRSTALLDPPRLYDGTDNWYENLAPTTSFRHAGRASMARADGSVSAALHEGKATAIYRDFGVGSVKGDNKPIYLQADPRW
ncbi:MAG: prepilin-type N-terminal cleavage/methylation domain-containing protein [Planctomycetota bacterium]